MNVLELTPVSTLTPSSHPYIRWTPILLGAAVAAALSSIMIAFGASVGLGVSSSAQLGGMRPWRLRYCQASISSYRR